MICSESLSVTFRQLGVKFWLYVALLLVSAHKFSVLILADCQQLIKKIHVSVNFELFLAS